jgi:hypothetical protein
MLPDGERRSGLSSPTAEFFAGVSRRGHEPLLERMDGKLRFDLSAGGRTQRWTLHVRRGNLAVTREEEDADCIITCSLRTFDRIARGETKPLAAWLRNQIAVEGRLYPLVMLERLLPGPPGSHDPRDYAAAVISSARRGGA